MKYLFLILFSLLNYAGHAQKYRLPPATPPLNANRDSISENELIFEGFPVVPSLISKVTLDGQKVLSLPILMEDSRIPFPIKAYLRSPVDWELGKKMNKVGRESIWFMKFNSWMLYSILIDFELNGGVGLGFLLIQRINNTLYEFKLIDSNDNLLYFVRRNRVVLDESIGESTFYSLKDGSYQDSVKFLWKGLKPEDFVMFTR